MSRLDQLYVEYMISTMGTLAINQLLSAIHRQSPARGEISWTNQTYVSFARTWTLIAR